MFLVLINDNADDMLGLSRLFADDTSIGHTSLDESTLKNMINIPTSQITLSKRSDNVTFSLLQRKNFTF